jgi:hypothetical protein
MNILLVIAYTIVSGVVYAYLENRWAEKLEDDGSACGARDAVDYKSGQIAISIFWLPLLLVAIFFSPAYLAYRATMHFIQSS